MNQEEQDFPKREAALQDAIETLKKQNKKSKEKLVVFWQKLREISKNTDGRNRAIWEQNMELWTKIMDLFGTIQKIFQEEQDLWQEELDGWREAVILWKEELDHWEKFSGTY